MCSIRLKNVTTSVQKFKHNQNTDINVYMLQRRLSAFFSQSVRGNSRLAILVLSKQSLFLYRFKRRQTCYYKPCEEILMRVFHSGHLHWLSASLVPVDENLYQTFGFTSSAAMVRVPLTPRPDDVALHRRLGTCEFL